MSGRPYVLTETAWKNVKNTDYSVAILPWGATEAHNYHLPYGADIIQVEYIANESARLAWNKGARVVVLPVIPFGVNTGQLSIKLVINMNPSTQAMVIEDIVDSLTQQGINKLLILNGHGGNDFKPIIRELSPKFPEIFISTLEWYKILNLKKYFESPGDHAGEMETSNILFINSDLVLPPDDAGNGTEKKFKTKGLKEKWVWAQRDWLKATEDTGIGNPELASAEKGSKFLEEVILNIADFLVEFSACNINDMYE